MLQWLITELHPQSPVLWLLISAAATIATAVVIWRYRPSWSAWLWVSQWLLIPYFGLLYGGLSPRLMGLGYINWANSLGLGLGLLFAILALLVVVRIAISHSAADAPPRATPATSLSNPSAGEGVHSIPFWRFLAAVVFFGGAEEFHWAFLRGAIWEILLIAPQPPDLPSYWAIWTAAGFVIAETALRRPTAEQWLVQIVTLAMTSVLFYYTRNFWLCWMLHSAAVLLLTTNNRTWSPLVSSRRRAER